MLEYRINNHCYWLAMSITPVSAFYLYFSRTWLYSAFCILHLFIYLFLNSAQEATCLHRIMQIFASHRISASCSKETLKYSSITIAHIFMVMHGWWTCRSKDKTCSQLKAKCNDSWENNWSALITRHLCIPLRSVTLYIQDLCSWNGPTQSHLAGKGKHQSLEIILSAWQQQTLSRY